MCLDTFKDQFKLLKIIFFNVFDFYFNKNLRVFYGSFFELQTSKKIEIIIFN